MKCNKSPCVECPYRRNSKRGHVSYQSDRNGYYEPARGVLVSSVIECHMKIIARTKKSRTCMGSAKFLQNLKSPGTHPEIFNTKNELQDHHVIYEGPVRPGISEFAIINFHNEEKAS